MSAPLPGRLRARRLARGLSQRRLAARLGRPHSLMSMWEAGLREPCLADLAALSRALGARVEELVEGTTRSPRRISSRAHGRALRRRVGARIRAARRAKGMTPRDVRLATGIRGRRLRRIEEGADANAAELEALRAVVDDYGALMWAASRPCGPAAPADARPPRSAAGALRRPGRRIPPPGGLPVR